MLEGLAEYGYWGLLLASFLAATILPFSSEVVFAALITAGEDIWLSVLYATIGNAAGGATCYYVGNTGKTAMAGEVFKINPEKINKTIRWLLGKRGCDGVFWIFPRHRRRHTGCIGIHAGKHTCNHVSMTVGKLLRYILIGFGTDQLYRGFDIFHFFVEQHVYNPF